MITLDQFTHQQQALGRVYAEGLRLARRSGRRQLVSVVRSVPLHDPLALVSAARRLGVDAAYWSVPKRHFTVFGVGVAAVFEGTGADRFKHAARWWRELTADALLDAACDVPGTGPLLLGGFAFDPLTPADGIWQGFPDARLVLPELIVTVSEERAWVTHNLIAAPTAADAGQAAEASFRLAEALWQLADREPAVTTRLNVNAGDRERWQRLVRFTADRLSGGPLQKVVLARAVTAEADGPLSPVHALSFLRSTYPDCFLFSFTRGERTFLGATPEQLVRLHGREVETMCLAASVARGRDPEEDRRLAEGLLRSEKERREHRLVLNMIRGELGPLSDELQHPEEPTILRLGNVQHLHTPVRARLREGITVFDVLERLHPTPAVGGTPRDLAMAFIRQHEGFHRGWYASPVGWVDWREEGEFAVALRSALVHGRRATLFAGCGIMPGSDPAAEYEESCLKLRPMLQALGGCV